MKQIKLGETVVVSDPCYELPTWCQGVIKNVLPGLYNVEVDTKFIPGWGDRICSIVAVSDSIKTEVGPGDWEMEVCSIGVDSGQAGIFDLESYRNDITGVQIPVPKNETKTNWVYNYTEPGEVWYSKMCELTLYPECGWDVYEQGVVARSGFGDGSYTLYTLKDNNKRIVGFFLEFITSEDLEEGDDDDDEDFIDPAGGHGLESHV